MNATRDDHHVSAALGELRDLPCDADWPAMEERLVHALAERPLAQQAAGAPSRAWWRWTAAAAAVVLAAAITFYLPSSRYGAAVPKGEPSGRLALPPSADGADARAGETKTSTPARTEPARMTPPATVTPKESPRAKPTATARPATTPAQQASAPAFISFVALPAAFSLPEFESGRIVRVEVPLTMLPAYGLELVPDAAPAAVQADFLIGQDGVPRAIRLASNSQ